MHFHNRAFDSPDRVGQSKRGVGISPGIQDNPGKFAVESRFLDAVDEIAFVIALEIVDFNPRVIYRQGFEIIVHRDMPVDFRLA